MWVMSALVPILSGLGNTSQGNKGSGSVGCVSCMLHLVPAGGHTLSDDCSARIFLHDGTCNPAAAANEARPPYGTTGSPRRWLVPSGLEHTSRIGIR